MLKNSHAIPAAAAGKSSDSQEDIKLTQKSFHEEDRIPIEEKVVANYTPVQPYKVLTFKEKIIVSE